MIETHTVNALLLPREDGGVFRSALMFLNGLVAPAFLFCAGLGFAISLRRHAGEARPGPDLVLTVVKKVLFILLVGYSMHVPVFSLRGLLATPSGIGNGIFQVDILQVIGVSLLALLAIAVLVRTDRGRIAAVSLLGAVVIASGAVAGCTELFAGRGDRLPVWLAAYFSPGLSPLFTLVPWAACLLAGFVAGVVFLRGAGRGEEGRTVGRMAAVSAAAMVTAGGLSTVTAGWYTHGSFWYWSAEYVVIRIAAVTLALCAVWALSRRGAGPAARVLGLFGRESLPVYYYHVIIVYGKDLDWSFVRLFPDGLGAPGCIALVAGLTGLMALFAWVWNSAKRRFPRAAAAGVKLIVAGSVATFLFS